MKFDTKMEFKDYVKLMYLLTYRRRGMIFTNIMGLFFLVFSVMYFIGFIEISEFPWLPVVFPIVVLFVVPISIYYSAKKNYNTHARLQEKITYEIDSELIKIYGESFNSEMTWEKTYKVLELNDWFLFYQNKLVANIIPKKFIGDKRYELREIVRNQKVKSKLKNN
ncbi:MAG: YcxB family protein [Breznakibacter sp.]